MGGGGDGPNGPATGGADRASAAKVKEADKIQIPPYPESINDFRSWRRAVCRAVCAASGRGNELSEWIASVFAEGRSPSDFATTASAYASIDAKLGESLAKIVKGDLATRLGTMTDEMLDKEGRLPGGRFILRLVVEEFLPNKRQHPSDAARDLLALRISGPSGLADFLAQWDALRQRCIVQVPESILAPVFEEQIKQARGLGRDMAEYDRMLADDPRKGYAWLRAAADRQCELDRENKLRHARRRLRQRPGHLLLDVLGLHQLRDPPRWASSRV